MSDFEPRLKQLLAERVDAELGPRRQPPRFDPQVEEVYPVPTGVQAWVSRPVLLSLVAAACIVAILLGTVGLSRISSSGPTPPAVPTPTPGPSPSATNQSVAPAPSVPPAATRSVALGGATLTLPPGWVARPYQSYDAPGSGSVYDHQGWCLTPSSAPISTAGYGCPVTFALLDPTRFVDTDTKGGYASDPQYCPDYNSPSTVQAADRSFGGRPADYRLWRISCHNGESYRIEQYVVPTGPGYVLLSQIEGTSVDGVPAGTVAAAMTEIAGSSTLPPQTAPLRFYDTGYIRSLRHVPGGILIRIDRVTYGSTGVVNTNPATYSYLVPNSRVAPINHLTVGRLVVIQTDGHRVTSFP